MLMPFPINIQNFKAFLADKSGSVFEAFKGHSQYEVRELEEDKTRSTFHTLLKLLPFYLKYFINII